ncbi:MAG: CPBP family intramembrane metalloprotease [Elusimicrobia bacterium]|nr:CPBP family intramembrane metalloprotease [Elusimicrobiota bacterium]
MKEAGAPPQAAAADEAGIIIVIITGFSIILGMPTWLGKADVSWQRFLFTNSWLLGGVLLWSLRYPLQPISWQWRQASRLPLLSVFISAAIAVLGTLVSHGARLPAGVNTAFDYLAFTTAGPAAEEFFYRGLCLNFLLRRLGSPTVSTILVSAFFVLIHFPARLEGISLAIVSVLLCVVALRTRSLWYPVLLHSGWNLCVLGWSAPPSLSRHAIVLVVASGLMGAAVLSARSAAQPE